MNTNGYDSNGDFDINNNTYIEDPWAVIGSYFENQHLDRLVRHQLESYNNFVSYQIIKTIEMFNPVNIKSEEDYDETSGKYALEMIVTFENFHIYRPQIHENNGAIKLMFPQPARLRNFTYASAMTLDINIKYIIRDGENLDNVKTLHKTLPKIHIGKLPIMLKSCICVLNQYKHVDNQHTGECKYDAGGYFIINGSEKTVLGQERAAENRVYCFNISKNVTNYTWKAEIKSVPDYKCISPKQINMMISSKNNGFGFPICIQIPRIKQPVPLFIVFRALNVISDKEICEYILLDISLDRFKPMLNNLKASVIEANKYLTYEDAIKYITSQVSYTPLNMDKETGATKKSQFALEVLQNDLFPHCRSLKQKIYFLGYMANKLLQASFGWIKGDDRDSYINKRVDTTGTSLNNLFRNHFNKLVKDMEKQILKEIKTGSWRSKEEYLNIVNLTNIYKIIKSNTIENGFKRALSTGDFGIKHTNSNKVGVAQVLNRLTYIASLSHLRRVSTPTDKSGKLVPPRKLHNTSWGFICPAECFDPETEILMWDGSIKLAKDVIVGDILIDDLGNPTTVRTTCSGQKNMYDIIPDKPNFMKHRVTDNHIQTLKIRGHKVIREVNKLNRKYTHIVRYFNRDTMKFQEKSFYSVVDAKDFINEFTDDDTLDITIENYLKLEKSVTNNLALFKTISNPDKDLSHFKLVETGIGPYVGWQLHDKRGRFCLKDGLVVHNTPEGASVGVVKNMSYMAHITVHSHSNSLYDYILPTILKIEDDIISPQYVYDKVKVFINGAWVGVSLTPVELYAELKEMKLNGIINIYTSVIFDYRLNEIRVCNDSGRLTRPLLRVKNNNILITKQIITDLNEHTLTWDDLLTSCKIDNAVIEYIDPEEQCFSRIATKPKNIGENNNHVINKFTHCEIHPSTMFGVVASCIPYPDHNQSPRNTYQCAQAKQAMGIYTTNFDARMDKTAYVLTYPTRPLVDTRVMNLIKLNENPSGCNITVAIMTHTGYNQEDSLLINKGSIDRGLLQITITHTEKDEDKQKINGDEEIRCKPDPSNTKGMKIANYNKVNSKGLVPENTLIENRDIIIAKKTPIKENRNDHTKIIKYEDGSKSYNTTEETYIDKNYIDRNGDGYSFAKVRLRSLRKPVIGDKFSSRHGQKGTVGNIIPEEDMPFTSNGSKPDIIINPHAIPSRMTIGHVKETQVGKILSELGLFGDGTSFGELDVNFISNKLLELGYEAHGNELLYNGLTGEQIECSVFMGPVFYQRLKHMVTDKQHSRASGPMVNLTRQPAEGRSRGGGLRFGEMERDCGTYHSPIPLTCGLSVELGTMEDNEYKLPVLGWDSVTDTLISSSQIGFMHKGIRECVDVTLQDGRKLRFTANHKMLTNTNTWTPINQFIVGDTRLKTGINYPLMKVADEIIECNNWSLNVGILLETNNPDAYFKTLAFCRLLGYISADGGLYYELPKFIRGQVNLGHMIDVNNVVTDLSYFCEITQTEFKVKNYYTIHLPDEFINMLLTINSTVIGNKIKQPTILPEFILDPACPKPIIREFLGGLFGADGHTCILGMHRGKRDILSSISYSKCKHVDLLDNLTETFEHIKDLFGRFDINNVTIQGFKETTYSKQHTDKPKTLQLTLHLSIDELISFSEKIGFRYCCHKTQRLEAGVSYKRLKNEVVRQRAWIINRIDELTDFKKIKEENPNKNIKTTKAIQQAVDELTQIEPIVHPYAIPTRHNVVDSLKNGSQLTIFRSGSFPTPEEYFKEIGAIDWFTTDATQISYGVHRCCEGLPTMNLKVIDIRPAGEHDVYDIEVENTHSFLANGVVAHNCMVSHGASRFTRGRMYDASDKYQVYVCKKCGLIASYNDELHIHCCRTCDNRVDFAYVEIPYACKLLFQELTTMNVVPRIMTE
jgi:DNA-directed RNA polymerase beta subunit